MCTNDYALVGINAEGLFKGEVIDAVFNYFAFLLLFSVVQGLQMEISL